MATTNLSDYDKALLPDCNTMKIGIVVAQWNADITDKLLRGAMETLTDCGVSLDNIQTVYVPGSFELPTGARLLLENTRNDAVICLGSIIRGETPHFDIIAHAVAQAVQQVALVTRKPVIFGVLTDETLEQAQARSGGSKGNKGVESAVAALKMVGLQRDLENSWNL